MKRSWFVALVGTTAMALGLGATAFAPAATAGTRSVEASCGKAAVGYARCFALRVVSGNTANADVNPSGYHPADLQSAYKVKTKLGTGKTIGIVDAYDDPNAESDLAVYRAQFGLPACTTANGCFKKVNQTGGTSYPAGNVGWAEEISLDLDMASAICPKCKILLVETTTNSFLNLAAGVDEAAALHATAISNSYGGSEFSTELATIGGSYNHPGIPITASTGDSGYAAGPQVPAAFKTLTAVGGTSLNPATNARGWKETVWSGAGSGCSIYIAKPAWQHDTGCSNRTIGDVSAVADPATGVSVYDSYGEPGWLVFGGTSASAPIVASLYAMAKNAGTINDASYAYSHTTGFFDVKKGSNGSCGGSYLCTGKKGYDAPTGLGTPKGVKGL